MAKILVVEDDEFFGVAIRNTIEASGHEVVLTETGMQAVKVLTEKDFDCVVSDVQMPGMSGLELLRWVQVNKPTPFIVMTGFAENMDTQNALRNGAVNFILKPFSEQDVYRALALALEKNSGLNLSVDPVALGYCRIPKGTLYSQGALGFNIYAIQSGGLIKIATKGEAIDAKKLPATSSVEYYTEKESLSVLIPTNLMITKSALSNQTVDPKKKMDFLRHTLELLQEKIKFDGLDAEAFKQSHEYIECTLQNTDVLTIYSLLEALNEGGDLLAINSLGVTCLSLMIANELGWAQTEMFKVTISGFFHDIGKLALRPRVYAEPRTLLTVAEKTLLDDHPRLGRDLLIKTNLFGDEIPRIVYQHHEKTCGTGYPEKLVREQIHPIARLLNLADTFCKLTLRGSKTLCVPADKAVGLMEQEPGLDLEYFLALKRLVGRARQEAKIG